MDVDAFVFSHRGTWRRLDHLVKRRRHLSGAEVDELVDLYQRVSTHLSMVRSASTDSVLIGRLSSLVARARAAVTGAQRTGVERVRPVLDGVIPGGRLPGLAVVGRHCSTVLHGSGAHRNLGRRQSRSAGRAEHSAEIDQLVNHDFASYYSEHPAASFALHVWVNNSWVAAQCIAFAVPTGHPDSLGAVSERRQLGHGGRVHGPRR